MENAAWYTGNLPSYDCPQSGILYTERSFGVLDGHFHPGDAPKGLEKEAGLSAADGEPRRAASRNGDERHTARGSHGGRRPIFTEELTSSELDFLGLDAQHVQTESDLSRS